MDNHNDFCSFDLQPKSPSDSNLLTMCKINNRQSTEIKYDSERQNEDLLVSKLVSNKVEFEKAPKSTDTLFEIPDMPSSAGSSFCRSTTSSSCSTQSTIYGEDAELHSPGIECDVCSSTLTLMSQSYVPSESTSPAVCCSIPIIDETLLVILDSATAILELPPSVTCCSTDCLLKKPFINTDNLTILKDSALVEPLQPISQSIIYTTDINHITDAKIEEV
uniref:Uncharacterized protein n=1 Tax=Strigamia maritima TaxID=126957 RepID=T1J9C6_STRMM